MVQTALESLKIADFGWMAAAPLVSKYLGDFGATVVKVESNRRPCLTRISAPYMDGKPHVNRGGVFPQYNSSKYSIALDLTNPRGLEVARRLVVWSDAVIEGFAAGVMEKFGLGYEDLKKLKSNIIMLRSCNQGQTGPYASHPGTGLHLVGLSGFTHLTGWPDRDGVHPFGGYTDFLSARLGATALLAALDHRNKTGEGACLDLSQLETSIRFIAPVILDYTVNKREMKRAGNSCACAAPHGVYPCKGEERWCAITVFTDEEWRAFCEVTGRPDLAEDPRFATLLARKKNEKQLDPLVEHYTRNHAAEDIVAKMQEAGVPCGLVKNMEDLFEDPQLKHRQAFWTLNHSDMGPTVHLGQPFTLSKTPAGPRAAPCLGEHTEFVCREILGMNDEEFVDLLGAGAFE